MAKKANTAAVHQARMKSDAAYAKRHRDRMNAWQKQRFRSDPQFRALMRNTRDFHMLFRHIRTVTEGNTFPFIGCTAREFIDHLESQFQPGWTWQNYSKTWTLDHIKSVQEFDLTNPADVLKCWHYTNLRPYSKAANIRRGTATRTSRAIFKKLLPLD